MKFIVKEENEDIYNEYIDDNGRKLDKLCKYLIRRKNMPQMYDDDLYGVAIDVFMESINTYDKNNGYEFHTYLQGNIWRAFYDWTRDNFYRSKRCNLQTDKHGNIMKGEDGKPIIIQNVSLDMKIEDDIEWSEKVESDFNLDNEISEEFGLHTDNEEEWHQEVKDYLSSLSPLQKQIIHLLSIKFTPEEICEELHITKKHYNNSFNRMTASDKIKPMEDMIERMNRSCSC